MKLPKLSQRQTDAIRVVGAILAFALTLAVLVMLAACFTGCAALGLAASGAELLGTAQSFASAKVAEAEGRAQFFAAGAAGIAALVPIAARYIDHRMKKKA